MASNTARLGLLKKDPLLDGADTFNLKTMLNDNWDKIDKLTALIDPVTGKLLPGQENPVDVSDIQKKLDTIETSVGNLPSLETVEKKNLVAAINEIRRALTSHLADKASKITYGHVKIGSGINVVDGEISVSEMTATNVSTKQGPSVQETLDSLKSVTDNKIQSVATAIVSKGGTVAGTPPTASQLVTGVNSIPTGGLPYSVNTAIGLQTITGLDELNNIYCLNSSRTIVAKFNKEMTALMSKSFPNSTGVSITPFGYVERQLDNSVIFYQLSGTMIQKAHQQNIHLLSLIREDLNYIGYDQVGNGSVTIYSPTGTILVTVPLVYTGNSPMIYLNKKGNFIVMIVDGNSRVTEIIRIDKNNNIIRLSQIYQQSAHVFDSANW